MKHLKKFESFSPINEEEGLKDFFKGADEKAYKKTVDFINGDSEEAKKIKELYKGVERDKDGKALAESAKNKQIVKDITRLGVSWASKNRMDSADYTYKQIDTVMQKDFSRAFKGGANLTVGESLKFKK
jgi:hypothetical protein